MARLHLHHLQLKQLPWVSIIAAAAVALFTLLLTLTSLQHGTAVSTYPTDGTFQIYDPLRRMQAGQTVGSDFPFFHGIGVPIILYPFFLLFGGNLFAAETIKFLVSGLAFVFCTLVFFYAYFRNTTKTLVATAIMIMVTIPFVNVIEPGGSLRGFRGTFPILVAAAMMWNTTRVLRIGRLQASYASLAAIALIAVAFVCGTEHGIASIIAYLIVRGLMEWRRRKSIGQWVASIAIKGVLIILATLVLVSLITEGNPVPALQYALIDVPGDQGWYFGAPPNPYLSWDTLLPGLFHPGLIPYYVLIAIGGFCAYLLYRKRDVAKFTAAVFLSIYGVVIFLSSAISYWAPGTQLVPLERVLGLFAVAVIIDILLTKKAWLHALPRFMRWASGRLPRKLAASILVVIVAASAAGYGISIKELPARQIIAASATARHSDDYFAANADWKGRLDAFRPYLQPGTTIWSTYVGAYESYNGFIRPAHSGEDYIIHALGDERRAHYLQDFIHTKPEYATTLVPSFFQYEEWLWSTSGDFYTYLLSHYTIVAQNDSHYLWKRNQAPAAPTATEWQNAAINQGRLRLPKNNGTAMTLYEVELDYSADAPIGALKRLSRYLLTPEDLAGLTYPISLPPNTTRIRLIIPVAPQDKNPGLASSADSLISGVALNIRSAKYRPLAVVQENLQPYTNNYCHLSKDASLFCTPNGTISQQQ